MHCCHVSALVASLAECFVADLTLKRSQTQVHLTNVVFQAIEKTLSAHRALEQGKVGTQSVDAQDGKMVGQLEQESQAVKVSLNLSVPNVPNT